MGRSHFPEPPPPPALRCCCRAPTNRRSRNSLNASGSAAVGRSTETTFVFVDVAAAQRGRPHSEQPPVATSREPTSPSGVVQTDHQIGLSNHARRVGLKRGCPWLPVGATTGAATVGDARFFLPTNKSWRGDDLWPSDSHPAHGGTPVAPTRRSTSFGGRLHSRHQRLRGPTPHSPTPGGSLQLRPQGGSGGPSSTGWAGPIRRRPDPLRNGRNGCGPVWQALPWSVHHLTGDAALPGQGGYRRCLQGSGDRDSTPPQQAAAAGRRSTPPQHAEASRSKPKQRAEARRR